MEVRKIADAFQSLLNCKVTKLVFQVTLVRYTRVLVVLNFESVFHNLCRQALDKYFLLSES